jgi:hypothetical protein
VKALLLLAFLALPAAAKETGNTIRFTPSVRLYECPKDFVYRSDCAVKEKVLEPQKLELNVQVLTNRMGQWSFQATNPVAVSYFVIVVRGPAGNHWDYSVSAETGIPGSPAPFANARIEFPENAIPPSFGVSSATMEKDGKKFITELRLTKFSGPPMPAAKHPGPASAAPRAVPQARQKP